MEELEIEVLEANGYSYIDGGIVDAEGNYISALKLNGKNLKSESSKELWNRGQALEKKHFTSVSPIKNVKKDEKPHSTKVLSEDNKDNFPKYKQKESIENPNSHIANNYPFDFTYPLVLVASIIIYIIIKRLLK